jgi:hypothetical protein
MTWLKPCAVPDLPPASQPRPTPEHGDDRAERSKVFLGIVAKLLEVLGDERIQEREFIWREYAALHEDLAQRVPFVVNPAIEDVEQGVAIDEAVLQGEQPEQQIAAGIDGWHLRPFLHQRTDERKDHNILLREGLRIFRKGLQVSKEATPAFTSARSRSTWDCRGLFLKVAMRS